MVRKNQNFLLLLLLREDFQKNLVHFSICACHPCAGAMLKLKYVRCLLGVSSSWARQPSQDVSAIRKAIAEAKACTATRPLAWRSHLPKFTRIIMICCGSNQCGWSSASDLLQRPITVALTPVAAFCTVVIFGNFRIILINWTHVCPQQFARSLGWSFREFQTRYPRWEPNIASNYVDSPSCSTRRFA